MAQELQSIPNLSAARDVLRNTLQKSRDIDLAIRGNTSRLQNTKNRLDFLQHTFKDVACKCNLYKAGSKVDAASGPAASVLRIFLLIQDLQASLLTCSRHDDLITVQRIEDAVRLLKDNTRLVMLWLQDALQFLADKNEDSEWYALILERAMKILEDIQGIDQSFVFDHLENEFRRILTENSFSLPISSSLDDAPTSMALINPYPSFPVSDVDKMHAIIERLTANNRLQKCASICVEVRSSIVRAALQALDVHYLQLSLSEFDSVQSLECFVDKWRTHLQFTVRYLLEIEHRLCRQVFHDDLGIECFASIVLQSGFYDFIKFGNTITRGKKEAIKLLKMLDIFATLNKLRPDFNRLFSGKSCQEIQTETREIVKRVINGACEIFWDLSVQVEAQRSSVPPLDGCVPRLVQFVTDFCNALLEDEAYSKTLLQVLEIHCSWNNIHEFDEGILSSQIRRIVRELELNLQAWSEVYEDPILSYFFRMNNYWYFCENIKATKLGDMMGDEWIMAYKEEMEHYLAAYLRESWEKLPAFLSEDGLVLFPGGRAFDQDLARKRLSEFNNAFEDIYTKQIYWVISDKGMRLRTRHLIAQTITPCYEKYVRKYMPHSHREDDAEEEEEGTCSNKKHVKYSSASLQDMINFLFQPKLGKYGSTNKKNSAVSHFSLNVHL